MVYNLWLLFPIHFKAEADILDFSSKFSASELCRYFKRQQDCECESCKCNSTSFRSLSALSIDYPLQTPYQVSVRLYSTETSIKHYHCLILARRRGREGGVVKKIPFNVSLETILYICLLTSLCDIRFPVSNYWLMILCSVMNEWKETLYITEGFLKLRGKYIYKWRRVLLAPVLEYLVWFAQRKLYMPLVYICVCSAVLNGFFFWG